jgi:hypothetical protein
MKSSRISRRLAFTRPGMPATAATLPDPAITERVPIYTVARTQQIPVTPPADAVASFEQAVPTDSDTDTDTDIEVAPITLPAPTIDGPPVEPPPTPTAPSNTSLVAAELVNGLRGASRHLARPSGSESHLRTELTIAARRIDSLVRESDAYDEGWAISAMALIHDAGFALEQRRISDGWQLLRAAQAEILAGLDRRGLAVERVNITGGDLVVDDEIDTDELRAEVWAMRQTKNRHHAELDRRLVEGGRSLLYRGMMLLAMLVFGALGVLVASPSSNPDDALSGIGKYLTIVGIGMTGAAVSHVLFTRGSERASSISEVVNPLQIVLLRLALGGVVGLLLVVVLQSDTQSMINVSGQAAYIWALIGGFSERYVDRLIDQVEASAYSSAEAALREGD